MRKFSMLLLVLLAGCAQAPGGGSLAGKPAPADSSGMAPGEAARIVAGLPAELGGMRRDGDVTDHGDRPGAAGLGASRRYVDPATGSHATIFLYDRGQARPTNGGVNPAAAAEMDRAVAEIALAARLGIYRSARFVNGTIVNQSRPDSILCSHFEMVLRDGAPSGDAVCLTVFQQRFVKVRVTMRNPPVPIMAEILGIAVINDARTALTARYTAPAPVPGAAVFAALP